MDVLLNILEEFGFEQVSNFDKLCVVHCVPGAGKSSFVRSVLNKDSRFSAYTFGVEDQKSLGYNRIKRVCDFVEEGKLVIIDEYTQGDFAQFKPICVIGDPLQSTSEGLKPSFVCKKTKRFGVETCALLKRFNFDVESERLDTVQIKDPFVHDPEGVLISIGKEAYSLATSHGLKPLQLEEFRGITCSVVTLLTSEETIPEGQRAEFFVALTRHKDKLIILSPNAIFGPTRQF